MTTNHYIPLVGRGPELRQLSSALARVEAGASEIITVDGAPGTGKTRLIDEVTKLAAGLGWTVVRRFGSERTQSITFDGLEVPPDSPLLVAVDDTHWIDDAGLAQLRLLGCQRRDPRLLVLCTFRPSERNSVHAFRRACASVGGPALSLLSLDDRASRDLAVAFCGRDLAADEFNRLKQAGGIPKQIFELFSNTDQRKQIFQAPFAKAPIPLTPLIGRGSELNELTELLGRERLISLVGTGGAGKTRLAQELARLIESSGSGSVCWVEVAPRNDAGVAGAVALSVGVSEIDGQSVIELVGKSMNHRGPVVLILDNVEHVLGTAGNLAARLLADVPGLRILCTSREPLDLRGEVIWRVPTLPVPDMVSSAKSVLADVGDVDSVALFVERAARVRRGFTLTESNVAAVCRICERVEGIPLAIELAAARVRAMSPERIAGELEIQVPSLSHVVENANDRHLTIEASIAWSEGLLDSRERAVFRRLAVFVGGFTLDAAQAVVPGNDDTSECLDPFEVPDLVTRLVDKSLVVLDDEQDRFTMLETIRIFALARLNETGELAAMRSAHATWFAGWLRSLDEVANAEDAQQFIDMTPGWIRKIAPEAPNCHAAFAWVETGGAESLRLTAGLGYYWLMTAAYETSVRYGLTSLLAGDPKTDEWGEAAMWLINVARNASSDGQKLLEEAATSADANLSGRAKLRMVAAMQYHQLEDGPTPAVLELFARVRGEAHQRKDWITFTNCVYIPSSICAEFGMLREAEDMLGSFVHHRTVLIEALCETRRGNLESAERAVVEASRMVREDLGNLFVEVWEVAIIAREIELLKDDRNDQERRSGSVVHTSWIGAFGNLEVLVDALSNLVNGHLDLALPELRKVEKSHLRIEVAYAKSWLARVHMALGATAAARDVAEELLDLLTDLRAPAYETTAHLVVAEAELLAHKPTSALERAHRALVAAADNELWVAAVDAVEAIGAILLHNGRSNDGARLLGAAQAERNRMHYRHRFAHRAAYVGTAHDVARPTLGWAEGTALIFADAIAFAQRMRGVRLRPTTGWESLTPTEVQVAEAVARGLSNPQVAEKLFMSRATVKTHLVHIFEKLAVRNRTELATTFNQAQT